MTKSYEELLAENEQFAFENEELRRSNGESKELLLAISSGEIDALVVSGPEGEQVFTLDGADRAYRVLIEAMNDGAVTMASDGTILFCNRRFAEMLKSPLEKVIGSSICRFIPQADQTAFRVLQRNLGRDELTLRADDESILPVYISINSLRLSESLEAFCVVVTDLTEQKRKDEIVAAEKLARSIIEQTTEAVVVCDESGKIIRFSKAVPKILGYDPSLQIFEDLFDLRLPNGRKLLPASSALHGDVLLQIEASFEPGVGRLFHLLLNAGPLKGANGKIIGCVITLMDITERKRAEEAQRKNEARFRSVLDNSRDVIYRMNIQTGRYEYISPSAEVVVGYSPHELMALDRETSLAMVHPDDLPAMRAGVARLGDAGIEELEYRQRTKNGDYRWISNRMSLIKDNDGQTLYRDGNIRDITDRKLAEEELREARDELEMKVQERTAELSQATEELECINEELRLEIDEHKQAEEALLEAKDAAEAADRAKSDFMANMSHEIRTPMNAVIGMTSLLLDDELLNSEQRDFIETIRMSGDALMVIINDILDFSKMQENKVVLEDQPFNLENCIEEALNLVAGKVREKRLDLGYTIDKSVPDIIIADPNRLRQILNNLLGNGVKFTEHGEVKLYVSGSNLDGALEIRFAIKDTGIGISKDQMDRLFQPFSQVDVSVTRNYGGTGLGLAISKKLVELMEGEIWAESEPGKGSTFYFTIKAETAPGDPMENLIGDQPQLVGKNVLIVNDNRTNRRILGAYIYSWGMVPLLASKTEDALDWIRRGDAFDVAILDMDMQDMDGLTLANEIRRYNKTLPLVILTSIGKHLPTNHAYLTKPIKPSQLHRTLTDIISMQLAQKSDRAKAVDNEIKASSLRILLAEDNITSQKVALQMLKRMGYNADAVANGIEALQALERQPYDLVLMDLRMPEMDGLQATRIIRQRWPDNGPKIVAVTAYALQGDKEKCIEAGMDDYISKPMKMSELADVLRRSQRKEE